MASRPLKVSWDGIEISGEDIPIELSPVNEFLDLELILNERVWECHITLPNGVHFYFPVKVIVDED